MRCAAIVLLLVLLGVPLCSFAANGRVLPKKRAVATEERAPAMGILSIIPAQGEPGTTVTLNGTGFSDKTVAYLGSLAMATKVTSPKILTFEIPDLPPGLYALYVKREDGATSKAYNFTLQAQKPVVTGISPDVVNNCGSGREREVTVSGRNFREGGQVLLDGAVIGSRYLGREAIVFAAPSLLASGLHQIQVKNPSDEVSGAIALFVNSRPEVLNVSRGGDFVNYYELIIDGRNFLQGSMLVVDGTRLSTGDVVPGGRERVIFADCTRLVYQRHPYDSTPKNISLQVVNPNGEESPVVSVNAP
ncbi:IPT/TIG domain-containing protein [Geotalea sp. SG265]|uniref:IPT/TIG domain-containing protein n=1 Tax=Geotalea sp. SG265 TaxID=2922867 RepID=UPI001FAFA891|nr:IPT/TIG domain-containing protein [Geotalea sp. SG265]